MARSKPADGRWPYSKGRRTGSPSYRYGHRLGAVDLGFPLLVSPIRPIRPMRPITSRQGVDEVRGRLETGRWALALFRGRRTGSPSYCYGDRLGAVDLGFPLLIGPIRPMRPITSRRGVDEVRGRFETGRWTLALFPGATDWKSVVPLRGPVGWRGLGISASYRSHPSHASHNIPAGRGRGSWQVRNRPMGVGLIPGGDGLEVRRTATRDKGCCPAVADCDHGLFTEPEDRRAAFRAFEAGPAGRRL